MAGSSQDKIAESEARSGPTRRGFLKGMGAVAIAADGLLLRTAEAAADSKEGAGSSNRLLSGNVKISLTINQQKRAVTVEPRTTLLSAMRDRLDPAITGPKLVCDAGTCGACTVILNGKPVYGCSVLAVDAVGKSITTVEGLGTPENLSPVQAAFIEKDAMMCGYCTSGFVTTVSALLQHNPNPTLQQVREGCKGNFCRCGTYPHVFEAALTAARSPQPQIK